MFPQLPSKTTGVRGYSHPGSGCLIEKVEGKQNTYRYVLINAMDLGGWLPSSIINSATTSALLDGTKTMVSHLQKLHASKS
jgi:hypothetical protein